MSNEHDKRMAAYALEKMFERTHYFDITAVRNACELMDRPASGKAFERLRALHCENWDRIPKDIMDLIPIWINELLGGPRVSVMQIPALREGNVHSIGHEDTPLIGES